MKKLIVLLAIPLLLATCSKDDEAEKQKKENATNGFTINGDFYPLKSGVYTELLNYIPDGPKIYREIAFTNFENYEDHEKRGSEYYHLHFYILPYSSSIIDIGEYHFSRSPTKKREVRVSVRHAHGSNDWLLEKKYGRGLLKTVIKSKITISKFTGTFISLNLRLEDDEGNIVTAKYAGKIKKR